MKILTTTAARIFFGLPFIVFGLFHFMNGGAMAGIVPAWLPGGVFWVYVTGLGLIAGGIGIMANILGKYAALGLALLLLVFILTVHLPNISNQQNMMALLKDMGLMGGALAYAGIFGRDRQD